MDPSGGNLLGRVVRDESGDPVEGFVRSFGEVVECLEDVRGTGGDVKDDGHAIGCGLRREAHGTPAAMALRAE